MNISLLIDEIEQLVENSKGVLGKRLVEEEAFFAKVQQLRSALPPAMKSRNFSASAAQISALSDEISRGDKLRLIAQWSAQLADDES